MRRFLYTLHKSGILFTRTFLAQFSERLRTGFLHPALCCCPASTLQPEGAVGAVSRLAGFSPSQWPLQTWDWMQDGVSAVWGDPGRLCEFDINKLSQVTQKKIKSQKIKQQQSEAFESSNSYCWGRNLPSNLFFTKIREKWAGKINDAQALSCPTKIFFINGLKTTTTKTKKLKEKDETGTVLTFGWWSIL